MRQPSILDVLRAVREVGRAHPEVRAWWYAPGRRARPQGKPGGEGVGEAVEIVVETDAGAIDLTSIGGDLADRLRRGPVSVRPHRGTGEELQLYRLLSRGNALTVS
jgi:hypothetical protein